jgi:hypothetical protein
MVGFSNITAIADGDCFLTRVAPRVYCTHGTSTRHMGGLTSSPDHLIRTHASATKGLPECEKNTWGRFFGKRLQGLN